MTFQFVRDLFAPPAAARARALAAKGRWRDAIAMAERGGALDPALAAEVVTWRRAAFAPGRAATSWPPALPDPFPDLKGLPEIEASALTGAVLGGAILHHGCLLVRGLAEAADIGVLSEAVLRAFEAARAYHDAAFSAVPSPWYSPFPLTAQEKLTHVGRSFTFEGGGVWTPDAPPALEALLGVLKRRGVVRAIADYLGEEPYVSVGKSTLRKVPVDSGRGWHQDGAFLGADIRTVNCWLSLSHCGVDAPGLDLLPRRIGLVETGTRGAYFDWSVGDGVVEDLAQETPVVSPVFAPGDALLFDHLFLHSTGVRPGMTRERLAIETWFFAGSNFPMKQIPLAI